MESEPWTDLSHRESRRLSQLRSAESLQELVDITGADTVPAAYLRAKREWRRLMDQVIALESTSGLAGDRIDIDGHEFWVHGVTHSGSPEMRGHLRRHVKGFLDGGATVYCEQGIRQIYFDEFPITCEMDDYRWAQQRYRELDVDDSGVERFDGPLHDGSDVGWLRERVFALILRGTSVYGDSLGAGLGRLASWVFRNPESLGTGRNYRSYRLARLASRDPTMLRELQNHYTKTFLPQPVEREWLSNHDPGLELVTHARNERMADYAVYHNESSREVHLVVGAAHHPGVVYYLNRYAEGEKQLGEFQLAD